VPKKKDLFTLMTEVSIAPVEVQKARLVNIEKLLSPKAKESSLPKRFVCTSSTYLGFVLNGTVHFENVSSF